MIVVQPGEKVPIDGVIAEGTSSLNTSALTGESLPQRCRSWRRSHQRLHQHDRRAENPDDKGIRRIHGIRRFWILVENSSSKKSRSENFISKFAQILYACGLLRRPGAGDSTAPCAACCFMGLSPEWGDWIYRALTFLVISCPVRAGHQYSSQLLRRNRRRQQGRACW